MAVKFFQRDAPRVVKSCLFKNIASMQRILIGFIRGYQTITPVILPKACRFNPSCLQYALEAIQKHGAIKGLWMAFKRILKCSPFSKGGYDPVR